MQQLVVDNKGVNMSADAMEDVFDKKEKSELRLGAVPPLYILLSKKEDQLRSKLYGVILA